MSRGGTRRARAQQAAQRKARERKGEVARAARAKAEKKPRKKSGRGRAALVHLSSIFAPVVMAVTLTGSGVPSDSVPGSGFWFDDFVDDANASYFAEPAGLAYAALSFLVAAGLMAVFPIWLWKRLNKKIPAPDRDRAAVDTAVTLVVVLAIVWVARIVFGYSDQVSQVGLGLLLVSVYVPFFSALFALLMPIVPGSGRIGGALPEVMRFRFTRRFLLNDEEREEVDRATEEFKAALAAERARRRARRRSKNASEPDDPNQDEHQRD